VPNDNQLFIHRLKTKAIVGITTYICGENLCWKW